MLGETVGDVSTTEEYEDAQNPRTTYIRCDRRSNPTGMDGVTARSCMTFTCIEVYGSVGTVTVAKSSASERVIIDLFLRFTQSCLAFVEYSERS